MRESIKRTITLTGRNVKEIMRDPLSLAFTIAMPLFMEILFYFIFHNLTDQFAMKYLAPGIVVFSQSFLSLFVGLLIAVDRGTAFLTRLYVSKAKSYEFIFGYMLAVLPLVGVHMAVILYVCIRLRLNKVMALAIQNLFMPPFSPFLCIELGHFMRHGHFWTEFTLHNCVNEMHHRLYEWLLGSLALAPLFAVLAWCAVYLIASGIRRRMS